MRLADQEAVSKVIYDHWSMVYRTCLRILGDHGEAEDATQEVFVIYCKKQDQINALEIIPAWLHRTASHVALRRGRASMRRVKREAQGEHTRRLHRDSGSFIDRFALKNDLSLALNTLPGKDREMLELYFFDSLPLRQIADRFGVGESAVSMRLKRVLNRLRTKLSSERNFVSLQILLAQWSARLSDLKPLNPHPHSAEAQAFQNDLPGASSNPNAYSGKTSLPAVTKWTMLTAVFFAAYWGAFRQPPAYRGNSSDLSSATRSVLLERSPFDGGQGPFTIPNSGHPERLRTDQRFDPPTALAFDRRNRPYLLHAQAEATAGYLTTMREGRWIKRSFLSELSAVCPGFKGMQTIHGLSSIEFDNEDHLYVIIQVRDRASDSTSVLLYSTDYGQRFQAYVLPVTGYASAFLERRTGSQRFSGAPAIGLLRHRKAHPPSRWSSIMDFFLLIPQKQQGRLKLDPILVTKNSLGVSNHSGGHSFAVSMGRFIHFVYLEVDEAVSGNPTHIGTYDRRLKKVIATHHLVNATPKVTRVHATPVIASDGQGHLHVLSGAHRTNSFYHMRSLVSGRIDQGWTRPEFLPGPGRTYASLMLDAEGGLHTVFRGQGLEHQVFDLRKNKWSSWKRLVSEPHQPLRKYRNFYHQLYRDRRGALYVGFTYTDMAPNEIYPRALMTSEDNGRTWKLAGTEGFERRVRP